MYSTFYIIGIDPGNNTGVAIFELDSITLEIISITTSVVVLNNFIIDDDNVMLYRCGFLKNVCTSIYNTYKPKVLSMEAAFMNQRFPKAVMQLSQYTSTVEQTFHACDNFIKIFKYPPKFIKKEIGGGGSADKNAMLIAVNNIPEISSLVDLNRTTEHEVDALAIGYITIAMIRQNPHVLISF